MKAYLALALLLAGCPASGPSVSFKANCTAGAPTPDALIPAGKQADGSVILPGGRRLTPAGRLLTVGGFPLALRVLPPPNDRYVVITDGADGDESLRLVDLRATDPAKPVVSEVVYAAGAGGAQAPALFYGLALTRSGATLYVSDGAFDGAPATETNGTKHYNVVEKFSIAGSPPQLTRAGEIRLYFLGSATLGAARIPAGLALSADEQTLYVANQGDGSLAVVDLATSMEIGRTFSLGLAPYDVAVDPAGGTVYVSLWGGRQTGPLLYSEGVVPVDVSSRIAPMPLAAPLATGKAAEQLAVAAGKLYVAASDADAVATLDLATRVTVQTSTAFDASGLIGSSPNALAIDAAAGRLYVANAGEDAVQAFDLQTLTSLGRIPTAWYPTAVAVLADGTLLIASAKGLGGGPTSVTPPSDFFAGTLQVVPRPSAADLTVGDLAVHQNLTRPASYQVPLTCTGQPRAFPLPADRQGPTPIRYVFLVVRENKTYDDVLGDLPGANGSPQLAVFGGDVTPNLHALAKRFTNFDNFYSNAEQSLQGHHWTTAGMLNDYGEKIWLNTWGRHTRAIGAFGNAGSGLDHLTTPGAKPIWQLLDAAGLNYHNYGEVVNTSGAKNQFDIDYPGIYFALNVPDVNKIKYVISNLQDKTFHLEPFTYISLPNDHTSGTTPGKQTPASMIADNDEATGRLIDALSHSPYWPESAVFIVEDDPSDGGDHVEMHRSPCLLISPWARSGGNSSVHYDNPALWKTLTLLLGLGPMNLYDANAPAMYDAFSPTPDFRPYAFIPRKVALATNSVDAPMAAESAAIDWSHPDSAPLGRILWKSMKGADAEPPWGPLPLRRVDSDGD